MLHAHSYHTTSTAVQYSTTHLTNLLIGGVLLRCEEVLHLEGQLILQELNYTSESIQLYSSLPGDWLCNPLHGLMNKASQGSFKSLDRTLLFLIKHSLRLVDLFDDQSSLPWSSDLIQSLEDPSSSLSFNDPSEDLVCDFKSSVVMLGWKGLPQLPCWRGTFDEKLHTTKARFIQRSSASLWTNEHYCIVLL